MFSKIVTPVLLFLFVASFVEARPGSAVHHLASRELNNTIATITIHDSCNATERERLNKALSDTYAVATAARDYIVQKGADDVYKRYFGSALPFAVIGVFEHLLSGDKTGVLLRCDDIDQKCGSRSHGWNGHWRGTNATLETVICPLSYQTRKPVEEFCQNGYTVTESSPAYYFATDIIHRLYHIPTINNKVVSHYADEYADCMKLARDRPQQAVFNTHTLQYFASEAYALLVARPGEGCTGTIPEIPGEIPGEATETQGATGACREYS
ncbi:zincin [Marasmius fiardii PR-910]|nr:zincin [Marasmius fiardii PR-910]